MIPTNELNRTVKGSNILYDGEPGIFEAS